MFSCSPQSNIPHHTPHKSDVTSDSFVLVIMNLNLNYNLENASSALTGLLDRESNNFMSDFEGAVFLVRQSKNYLTLLILRLFLLMCSPQQYLAKLYQLLWNKYQPC